MTRRADHDAERQSDVLTKLRIGAGKSRTAIAVDLGMEADTYRRYEIGQTELRVNQVRAFARAYGVTARELLDALLPLEDVEPWNPRAAMERAGMPEADIQKVLGDIHEWGEASQRAGVAVAISLFQGKREESA